MKPPEKLVDKSHKEIVNAFDVEPMDEAQNKCLNKVSSGVSKRIFKDTSFSSFAGKTIKMSNFKLYPSSTKPTT